MKLSEDNRFYIIDGNFVPRVSTILQGLGIVDYSKLPPKVREMALQRGQYVHLACELYDKGTLDRKELDPVIIPYLDQYIAWKKAVGAKIIHSEYFVVGPRDNFRVPMWAGRLDRILEFQGKKWIVDLKCGKAEIWTGWQLGGYQGGIDENMQRMALELSGKPNQKARAHPFSGPGWVREFKQLAKTFKMINRRVKK